MDKLKMHSPDFTKENVAKLAELFPGCVVETKDDNGLLKRSIDFDQLRQELSTSIVEGPRERYHLDWPGKREALLTANAPIAKTLRPCREESVDFDTTKNLFIEGDNLDALKLLQETYLNKVKMIYIDPPYNTGKEFIYDDNFIEDIQEYHLRTNQKDELNNRLIANMESNGRFHSDWLSMVYPRLKLARNLLSEDGVIFISIDDGESSNLKHMCDEIFGESNFVGNFIWQSRTSISNDQEISLNHNHTLVFAKNYSELVFFGEPLDEKDYSNPDNDSRGPWKLVPIDANKPGGDTMYPIKNPKTNEEFWPPNGRSWAINSKYFEKLKLDGRIKFGISDDAAPKKKLYYLERIKKGDTKTPSSLLLDAGTTKSGTSELMELFDNKKIFDYPKPSKLLNRLINYGCRKDDDNIVMDFFAGSSSLAHACMNYRNVQYISVQIPEHVDETKPHGRTAKSLGFDTITDIGKERIRRAGKKIKEENADKEGIDQLDIGFRVLKVDSSNMNKVRYAPDALKHDDLFGQVDNIKVDRTPEDLLFQVLLDWGVDLTLPIKQETIAGKTVFFVDGSEQNMALAACFETDINEDFVKELATRKPLRVVFRDSSFENDSVKINIEQIFKLMSPSTDVKVI